MQSVRSFEIRPRHLVDKLSLHRREISLTLIAGSLVLLQQRTCESESAMSATFVKEGSTFYSLRESH